MNYTVYGHVSMPWTLGCAGFQRTVVEASRLASSYRLRLTTLPSRMQRHSPVSCDAMGSGTHMMMEYDDTDTIVMVGETGATVPRVPD